MVLVEKVEVVMKNADTKGVETVVGRKHDHRDDYHPDFLLCR